MDVDFERGKLYVSTFDGNLYRYKFSTPLDEVGISSLWPEGTRRAT